MSEFGATAVLVSDPGHGHRRWDAGLARVRAAVTGDRGRTSLGAALAFAIRIASAGLLYLSQMAMARWMGTDAYGIYVVVWTWVLVLGGIASLGLNHAVIRLVAEYRSQHHTALLRGVMSGASGLAVAAGTLIASLGAAGLWLLGDRVAGVYVLPAYLALVCIPLYALADVQDGIGRGRGWIGLGLLPPYVLRPALLLLAMAATWLTDLPMTATTAAGAAIFATWLAAILQIVLMRRAFAAELAPGPTRTDWRAWLSISLPLMLITAAEVVMQSADVLAVSRFLSPAEVGIYYAAAKTMSLILYVQYAVGSAMSHRFAAARAAGDTTALERAVRDSVHLTFWPSLAAGLVILALGKPLLALFGSEFEQGFPAMLVLVVGFLARSAIGPGEYLLRMLGGHRISAAIYVGSAITQVVLCFLLTPVFGMLGAALGASLALLVASGCNWYAARSRLGLEIGIWSNLRRNEPPAAAR